MQQPHTTTPADSPTKSRSNTSNYHSDYVGTSRTTLLADVPEIPEVTLESLLPAVLPDVSADRTLASVCEKIEQNHIKAGRWFCLPENPTKNRDHETKVFTFVEDIFNCIVSTAKPSTPLVKCTIKGSTTPISQRANPSRPDGYVQLSSKSFPSKDGDCWADIVMPMEFKKSSKADAANDDFAKIVRSMHHTMRNDPRRRFVFGLTVENTRARLWFNDRCGIVSSTEFDLNEDWKSFVHIVLGMTRAKSEELGYDPDLKLTNGAESTSPQYDITIHSSDKSKPIYRTIRLINEVGAESIIGRGTRVWQVQRLDTNGAPLGPYYALKDVWVHDDRPVEHEVIAEITALSPTSAPYLLTVINAGFALGGCRGSSPADHTKAIIRRGKDLVPTGHALRPAEMRQANCRSGSKSTSISNASKRSRSVQSVPTLPQVGHWDCLDVNRFSRQHYRIVFKEIGTPLYELRSYQDIIKAVEGGLKGLEGIHEAGYVHRDVSSGNILLVSDENGGENRGVIIDLEYAKKTNSDSASHGVKTGTYEFMAIEVARSSYSFPRPKRAFGKKSAPKPNPPAFRQNQLHDLESVWWICAWSIFRLVRPDTKSTSDLTKRYNTIFQSHDARRTFWLSDFDDLATGFSDESLEEPMVCLCEQLRKAYADSYSAGDWADVNRSCLEAAREAQTLALDAISKATRSYPLGLQFLSELGPLPPTEEGPTGTKKRRVG